METEVRQIPKLVLWACWLCGYSKWHLFQLTMDYGAARYVLGLERGRAGWQPPKIEYDPESGKPATVYSQEEPPSVKPFYLRSCEAYAKVCKVFRI